MGDPKMTLKPEKSRSHGSNCSISATDPLDIVKFLIAILALFKLPLTLLHPTIRQLQLKFALKGPHKVSN